MSKMAICVSLFLPYDISVHYPFRNITHPERGDNINHHHKTRHMPPVGTGLDLIRIDGWLELMECRIGVLQAMLQCYRGMRGLTMIGNTLLVLVDYLWGYDRLDLNYCVAGLAS